MRKVLPFILLCVPLCAAVAGLAQGANSRGIRGGATIRSGTLIPDVEVTAPNVDPGISKDYLNSPV